MVVACVAQIFLCNTNFLATLNPTRHPGALGATMKQLTDQISGANGVLDFAISRSATKKGPGRCHAQGHKRGGLKKSRYVQSLLNHWAKKRRESAENWSNKSMSRPRDAHGAVTFVGKEFELVGVKPTSREYVLGGGTAFEGEPEYFHCRRIWLAGISAQRGF